MSYLSVVQRLVRWLVVAAFLGSGFAMAQSEPTMSEIYATAQAGKLDEAQKLITHVLVTHPNSAKAHFVQSELFARQGNLGKAREALAAAEKLAPGLPFAKPDAVQALRSQLSARSAPPAPREASTTSLAQVSQPQPSSASWGLPLLLTAVVIAGGYFIFRRRAPAQPVQQAAYVNQNGWNGPQTSGNPVPVQPPGGQPSSGLGGQIMGGVATGLAVGAGVMAAEAIGRNLMGHHNNQSVLPAESGSNVDYRPGTTNTDMGGQDFGINDNTSWDDGGASASGGDWDT
ncbi:MAG: hypothetical protein V4573_07050 [Pseudomonadota bacterium]